MVHFSFRPPNADYLGFPATTEGILESACLAEELGFDAVSVNDHIIVDSPRGTGYDRHAGPVHRTSAIGHRCCYGQRTQAPTRRWKSIATDGADGLVGRRGDVLCGRT
jgi:hypothetical protein